MIDLIGYIGTVAVLYGYYAVSMGKLKPESNLFYCLNFFGSSALVATTYHYNAMPPMLLNIFCASVALIGFIKLNSVSKG